MSLIWHTFNKCSQNTHWCLAFFIELSLKNLIVPYAKCAIENAQKCLWFQWKFRGFFKNGLKIYVRQFSPKRLCGVGETISLHNIQAWNRIVRSKINLKCPLNFRITKFPARISVIFASTSAIYDSEKPNQKPTTQKIWQKIPKCKIFQNWV